MNAYEIAQATTNRITAIAVLERASREALQVDYTQLYEANDLRDQIRAAARTLMALCDEAATTLRDAQSTMVTNLMVAQYRAEQPGHVAGNPPPE